MFKIKQSFKGMKGSSRRSSMSEDSSSSLSSFRNGMSSFRDSFSSKSSAGSRNYPTTPRGLNSPAFTRSLQDIKKAKGKANDFRRSSIGYDSAPPDGGLPRSELTPDQVAKLKGSSSACVIS
jgi:hypothetical protein